jgi:hypothetical protein
LDREQEMSVIYSFLLQTGTDDEVMPTALNAIAMAVSADVLRRFLDRFKLPDLGKEDFVGMRKWCNDFPRNYDHDAAALEMLLVIRTTMPT